MFCWSQTLELLVTRDHTLRRRSRRDVMIILSRCSSLGNKFKLPPRFGTGEKSVWVEYNALTTIQKPKVNLGQGFPDYAPPALLTETLAKISTDEKNHHLHQYARGFGHPRLVNSLAKIYSPLIGRNIDPMNEILVCCGAYEALYSTITGHIDTGDEVIVIEPFFDCYDFMIISAGGIPKFIPLRPKKDKANMTSMDWILDMNELEALFGPKTKMIIVNTPINPVGKVFNEKELTTIGEMCKKHNVLCLSDEVYEWMIYDPHEHIRMAKLPGMWDRTITICSAGKSFSVTGWKIGWAYGPANLLFNLQIVHQNNVFSCNTPAQEALGIALEHEFNQFDKPECSFQLLRRGLLPKRDNLVKTLSDVGFKPTVPDGGFFIMADWTNLESKMDLSTEKDASKDYRFTKKLLKETGVLCIPPTAFYSKNKKIAENYARFCFCKKSDNLKLADKLLREWIAKKK